MPGPIQPTNYIDTLTMLGSLCVVQYTENLFDSLVLNLLPEPGVLGVETT